ncbi:hypothetical protein BO94DRAFT_586704 [Aspergillus sclerotioniger CBS 115572]|uniref:Uncharacterized protein n=1 Tax=Aspergillus sclerotioniger CBS 115572 TaxID=1450535 RepID=A0A317WBQ6_9EURO|nr:hypothetical protein BO94DRAFT_586704 [Aspergillus sclerotioniger CBS 115572]PWY83639.1 hypothetical protein BO94DRAFT_586704 [Aspergillus sclerotioniger CBS 115572]
MERSSDVVKLSAYTPLLQHFGFAHCQHCTGLILAPGPSTSSYVQKMFSTNRGTAIFSVNTTANFASLYWGGVYNDTFYV